MFSNNVVEALCHTWTLIPDEQTATSGIKAKWKAQRTSREAEHTRALAAAGKSHLRSSEDKSRLVTDDARSRNAALSPSDETVLWPCTEALIGTLNTSVRVYVCVGEGGSSHSDKDIRPSDYSDCIIQRWREGQSNAPLFLQSEQNCWGAQTLFMVQSAGK